jgi:hypothetical protein
MSWSRAPVSSWRAGSARTGVSRGTRPRGLYIENPALTGIAQWFCAAIATMFGSMAYAVDTVTQSGFGQSTWLPVRSWIYSGGDYAIAVHGDRFLIAERAKLGSRDERSRLLRAGQP